MPSTENTTLQLIQQEIQDVIERERELKNYYNGNHNNNSNHSSLNGHSNIYLNNNNNLSSALNGKHADSVEVDLNADVEDAVDSKVPNGVEDATHQQHQQQQVQQPNGNAHTVVNGIGVMRPALVRAKSASVGETQPLVKPHFRRLVSALPNTKGVMHRFLKSRGKLAAVTALSTPMPNGTSAANGSVDAVDSPALITRSAFAPANTLESYEIAPPKMAPGQRVRKGFMSAEEKIQRDIADTYRREAELKTLRQSQGNLTLLDDAELDAPLPAYMGGGLRGSKSMAQLYASNEMLHVDDEGGAAQAANNATVLSAPASLKPARSLAQLCDAPEEEVTTSSQSLIMRFEQMIIKNQVSNRA